MRIAITGSIACGKSTLLSALKERGFPVISADAVSRELTARGGEALSAIRGAFGDGVFDGEDLNRKALGKLVFSDPAQKEKLEAILHPMIRERIRRFFLEHGEDVTVFAEIPLLYECGWEGDCDAVWVTSVPEEIQIERLKERDGFSREDAVSRIRAQMPLTEKERLADAVIYTDGPLAETLRQLDLLLSRLTDESPEAGFGRRAKVPAAQPAAASAFARFSSLPVPARILLGAAAATLLLTLAVLLLRDYGARLELRRKMELEAAERASHPLYYEEFIQRSAEENDLDPALVSAVILCESSFRPDAVSRLGARGLMQIMEDTASWIARRMNEDGSYSFDLMFDPETNIRYGVWYLGYLSRRFSADPKKIICAYHAGQGNVDSWLKNEAYSRDGISLDTIPTKDTEQYYRRVSDALRVYRRYYFPQPTEEPAPELPATGV